MEPINYTRLAMDDIHPEARRIAISWMEGWEEWMKSDIRHKVKLASDIQNFAIAYHQHELAQLQQHGVGGPVSDVRSEGEQLPAEALAQNGRDGIMKWCDSCGKITKWIDGDCENYKMRGGSAKGVLPR